MVKCNLCPYNIIYNITQHSVNHHYEDILKNKKQMYFTKRQFSLNWFVHFTGLAGSDQVLCHHTEEVFITLKQTGCLVLKIDQHINHILSKYMVICITFIIIIIRHLADILPVWSNILSHSTH